MFAVTPETNSCSSSVVFWGVDISFALSKSWLLGFILSLMLLQEYSQRENHDSKDDPVGDLEQSHSNISLIFEIVLLILIRTTHLLSKMFFGGGSWNILTDKFYFWQSCHGRVVTLWQVICCWWSFNEESAAIGLQTTGSNYRHFQMLNKAVR